MAELLKVREITIDTMQYKDFATKEEELKVMRFYQNDLNSAKLLINVTHDKVVTDFSTATKVQVAFQKPDGKRVFQDVQNVNQMQGKYYVVLSTQTLIAYGNVVAQLRLTFPNNKVIETCKFVFAVDESIMSDNAMESTNEFPVIQKAIEAGKKLEGVDIDGIIAAGALAANALPKAGGTMTGDIRFNAGKLMRLQNKAGTATTASIGVDANDEFYAWSDVANTGIFKYNPVTKFFNLQSDTNLLKKTGDSMTGHLIMDTSTGANNGEKLIRASNGANNLSGFALTKDGVTMYDWATNKEVWRYTSSTQSFDITTPNTNVVKKAGDNMTGNLHFEIGNSTDMRVAWAKTGSLLWGLTSSQTNLNFYDWKNSKTVWSYDSVNNNFVVSSDTNLLKKTGDTMTGYLRFDNSAGEKGLISKDTIGEKMKLYFSTNNNTGLLDIVDNKRVWEYDYSAKSFNVLSTNTNLVTKAKDGRATITLTADGVAWDGTTGSIADRRGNVVTLRLAIARKTGSASDIVATLPVDMRPTMLLIQNVLANDSSNVRVMVESNGSIKVGTEAKNLYAVITYVID